MNDLKGLRRQKHLTQQALAAGVGVSKHTIRLWEDGTSQPAARHVPKLAEVLGIDAAQLPAVLQAAAEEKRQRALAGRLLIPSGRPPGAT